METEGIMKSLDKSMKTKTHEYTAGSLATLLGQVVHSEDETQVCKLLYENSSNQKVVTNTVQRIPKNIIHTLLTILTRELVRQPNRTTSTIKWLKALVSTHLTYVSSNEKCRQCLDKLYDIVKPQEDLYVPLLALQGKIELLHSYVKQNNRRDETDNLTKSAVVYDDDSEDDTEELWREVGKMNDHGTSDDDDMGMEDTDDNIDATTGSDGEEDGTTGTDGDEGATSELSANESEGD